MQRSPRPRLLLRPPLSPQPPRASDASALAARVGATRGGPSGVTSDVVAAQAQVCQFRCVGLFHGLWPHDRRVGHRARLRRPQVHECGAGVPAHPPHAPVGHPHPVLRHLVLGPQQRVVPPLGLAGVSIFLVMPQLAAA